MPSQQDSPFTYCKPHDHRGHHFISYPLFCSYTHPVKSAADSILSRKLRFFQFHFFFFEVLFFSSIVSIFPNWALCHFVIQLKLFSFALKLQWPLTNCVVEWSGSHFTIFFLFYAWLESLSSFSARFPYTLPFIDCSHSPRLLALFSVQSTYLSLQRLIFSSTIRSNGITPTIFFIAS